MNRPVAPNQVERDAYYAEGESWAEDRAASDRSSRRTAWIIAAAFGAVAVLEAIALVVLLPLKTVEPYVVTVDRQTGFVETTQKLVPGGALTQNQAVTQAALVQYVLARESYDATDLKEKYRNTQWWSAPDERAAYLRLMAPQNPQSPLKLYGSTATVAVTVRSVSILGPDTALVRFDAERRTPGSSTGSVQPYAAAISFRWSGEPMRAEERFINPLGFQVVRYRRDAEAVAATPVPAPAPINPLAGQMR